MVHVTSQVRKNTYNLFLDRIYEPVHIRIDPTVTIPSATAYPTLLKGQVVRFHSIDVGHEVLPFFWRYVCSHYLSQNSIPWEEKQNKTSKFLTSPQVLLFIGVPQLQNLDDACRLKLTLDDFAIHDPTKDALFKSDAAGIIRNPSSDAARRGLFGVLFGKVIPRCLSHALLNDNSAEKQHKNHTSEESRFAALT